MTMTAIEQIRALLVDERGDWRENVSGADFVGAVSTILTEHGLGGNQDAATRPSPRGQVRDFTHMPSAAFYEEHPWCGWMLAFSDGSDWDTARCYGLNHLEGINLMLTTADGKSRPVNIVNTAWHSEDYYSDDDKRAQNADSGIETLELDPENDWEPCTPERREHIRYEDIREMVVF